MPRKRPNPFAPPTGNASDIDPGMVKNPRNFNAHVTKGGVKGTGRGMRKQTIAKVPNRYIQRLKKKKKGKVYDAKGHLVDKPSGVLIGPDKGMYRKTDAGYKKRRFTFKQRQGFRAKKGPVFGGPGSGRPKP